MGLCTCSQLSGSGAKEHELLSSVCVCVSAIVRFRRAKKSWPTHAKPVLERSASESYIFLNLLKVLIQCEPDHAVMLCVCQWNYSCCLCYSH